MSLGTFASTVGGYPSCDFCLKEGTETKAQYDFKTKNGGLWANGCAHHYEEHRMFDMLGEGRGQALCIPRPGTAIGSKIQLMPFSKRAVYKPAYLFVIEEDGHGWKGLTLNDRGEPTTATLYPYTRDLWRTGR